MIRDKLRRFFRLCKHQTVDYWNKPRPGEYMNNKQLLSYTVMASGMNIYNFMPINGFTFGATFFGGAVMGIANLDFVILGTIGTVMGYLNMWVSPINIMVFENHGRIPRKLAITANVGMSIYIVAAIVLYALPTNMFEGIIKGLPQLIANSLTITIFNFYSDWIVRRLFAKKYGRIKPLMIAYGVPLFIISCFIAYMPADMEYTRKLILLNLLFSISQTMHWDFSQSELIVRYLSPNTQERQRLLSLVPIISYALFSLVQMIYPVMTEGRVNEQSVFKLCVPLFMGMGILMAYSVIGCKENVIEDSTVRRKRVKFFESVRDVFRDKYLWMYNASQLFMSFSYTANTIINIWFLYSLRSAWMVGFIATIIALPTTLGQVLTVWLAKRYSKRTLLLWGRVMRIIVLVGDGIAILTANVPMFIAANMVYSITQCVESGISNGILPDIMDRHQYKYGVRCDSSMQVFNWFTPLLLTPLGYIMPFMQKSLGFTSDWDVLYDPSIGTGVFLLYIAVTIVGVILITLPYMFYNITNKKHRMYVNGISRRVREEERISNLMIRRDSGEIIPDEEFISRLDVTDDIVRLDDRR